MAVVPWRRSVLKAELHVALTLGSLLFNFVVPDMERCDVRTTDWAESDFRVKWYLKNGSQCSSAGHI
jgi:hypothetical protein